MYSDEKNVVINSSGLYQNILITGSIGSGKTSSAIVPILNELLSSSVYGLVIDVKGNFINTVNKIASIHNLQEKIVEISLENDFKYNPLASNISNFEMAARLKNILTLISR